MVFSLTWNPQDESINKMFKKVYFFFKSNFYLIINFPLINVINFINK